MPILLNSTHIFPSDATETMRKVGGNFKERLRELKGLDAIFEVVTDCHSTLEVSLIILSACYHILLDWKNQYECCIFCLFFIFSSQYLMENTTWLFIFPYLVIIVE